MTSEEWTWAFTPRAADQFDGLDGHVQDRIVSKLDEIVASEWRKSPILGGKYSNPDTVVSAMSADPGGLIALPLVIVICVAILAAVWIGGNGGDVSWITVMVDTLAVPALVLGVVLAGYAALLGRS